MSTTNRQLDSSVFAVLKGTGRGWRVVVARSERTREGRGKPTLLASREFDRASASRLDSWLDEHSASEVICILPASAVICRTCALPDAPFEHLAPALRLQAESHLFGIAPPHRLAMAVLEAAPGETTRSGLILAWPESAEVERPPTRRPLRFAPDIAALAALVNGHRPPQPLIHLDRHDGSIALAVSHASGVAFRSVREDADEPSQWTVSVGRVLAETAVNVGHSAAFVQSLVQSTQEAMESSEQSETALLLPEDMVSESAQRIDGAPSDPAWWAQFGIAAAGVLLHTGPLAALADLYDAAPTEAPSRVRDALEAMAKPAVARRLVIACILAVMFGPLAINWLRMTVLEFRHGDLPDQLELVHRVKDDLVVYRYLQREAWPMAKMLADISCNTPEGVELETIRINQTRSFTVRGRALPYNGKTATEVVVLMQQYLRDSGIFTEITLNWGDSDAYGNYEFELSARLSDPYRQHKYPIELDFGKWTVVDRRDGVMPEGTDAAQLASSTVTVAPPQAGAGSGDAAQPTDSDYLADSGSYSDDPLSNSDASWNEPSYADDDRRGNITDRPRATARVSPGGPGGAGTRDEFRSQGGVAPHQEIPEPMTEAQINAMTDSEVRDMLVRVSQARRMASNRNDEELVDRLQREFQWLMARMRGQQQ